MTKSRWRASWCIGSFQVFKITVNHQNEFVKSCSRALSNNMSEVGPRLIRRQIQYIYRQKLVNLCLSPNVTSVSTDVRSRVCLCVIRRPMNCLCPCLDLSMNCRPSRHVSLSRVDRSVNHTTLHTHWQHVHVLSTPVNIASSLFVYVQHAPPAMVASK